MFIGVKLGKRLIHNCFLGTLDGLSISWRANNTLISHTNRLETSPLHPSDNNTNYTCIITLQQNTICPLYLIKEYVIRIKSENSVLIMIFIYLFILATYITSISMKPSLTAAIASSAVIICNITLNTAIGPDLSVLNYTWYYGRTELLSQSEPLQSSMDSMIFTSRLNMTSIEVSNAGEYKCIAGIVDGSTIENVTKLCIKGMLNNCLI